MPARTCAGWAKTHGLSLGDRPCLTTARLMRRRVLTAERKWGELPDLGIAIQMIR
jgi:PIN domain nuclease of toxin-antitoxin system